MIIVVGPLCSEALSTLDHASEEDDLKCRDLCLEKSEGICKTSLNPWVCVTSLMASCYIPNKDFLTCQIRPAGELSAEQGSCQCPSPSDGACTTMEVMATQFVWRPTLAEHIHDTAGVIVARNHRALWLISDKQWHYENGPTTGKCQSGDWILGVFCRGTSLIQYSGHLA